MNQAPQYFLAMIGLSVYYAVKADPTEGDKQSFSYNITRNIAYILGTESHEFSF